MRGSNQDTPGGVGGPTGPLTAIVSGGFAAGAGCFACETFLTRVNGRERSDQ